MYDLSQVLKGLVNPRATIMEINKLYNRVIKNIDSNPGGVDFIERDWDNLIILDSCRYDIFEELSDLPGSLESVESKGTGTPEFLRTNFDGKDLSDTIYLTGNPQYYYMTEQGELETTFYEVYNVWQDRWDEDVETVHPETMTEVAKSYSDKHPDKKLIIHYNQPHGPYLGPTAEGTILGPKDPSHERSILEDLKNTIKSETIPYEKHRKAYIENLNITLPYVESLIKYIEGKSVVTADHGQMLGERARPIPVRYHTHPQGVYVKQLTEVPWLVYTNGERKLKAKKKRR